MHTCIVIGLVPWELLLMCDKLWSAKTFGHCDHRMSTNRSARAALAQRSLPSA